MGVPTFQVLASINSTSSDGDMTDSVQWYTLLFHFLDWQPDYSDWLNVEYYDGSLFAIFREILIVIVRVVTTW